MPVIRLCRRVEDFMDQANKRREVRRLGSSRLGVPVEAEEDMKAEEAIIRGCLPVFGGIAVTKPDWQRGDELPSGGRTRKTV